MSSVGGIGSSSSLQFLQQLSGSSGLGRAGGKNSFEAKFESAVKDAGGSNVNFSDLQTKIESAVKNVVQNASSSSDPSSIGTQIQSAVDSVLTEAGIDTKKLQSELGPPPSGGFGGPPPGGINGAGGNSGNDISSLLSALSDSSSTNSTNDSESSNTSNSVSSTGSTQSNDELVQQLLKDVFKNFPAGSFVNSSA